MKDCKCNCAKSDKRNRFNRLRKSQWLRRLRLRYIWECRQAIALDRSGNVLEFCAKQMAMKEVYALPDLRSIRYSIIRQLWRFDKASGLRWHDWTEKNGWSAFKWQRISE